LPDGGVIAIEGDQWKVPPAGIAVAVRVVDWPVQRFVSGEVITMCGLALIVITALSVAIQPVIRSVTVTV
jgi:hypothetical protein